MKQLFKFILGFNLLVGMSGAALSVDSALANLPFETKLQLARTGNAEAKLALAIAYELGQGVRASGSSAAKWYSDAALAGNLEAQFLLSKLVEKGGRGLNADAGVALKLLETAAKKGHAPSQNAYGARFENGMGVAINDVEAASWYLKAAEQGLAEAQNNYAVMLLRGKGVTRDLNEAFLWFTKAAGQNYGWALNNLGGMYEKGWGTAQDLAKAKLYYQQAGQSGINVGVKNYERLLASAVVN